MSALRTVIVFLLLVAAASSASALPISVPGTSDPWLAGMPNGSGASGVDTAPGESPVLINPISLLPGVALRFSASGGVANGPAFPLVGPDGYFDPPYPLPASVGNFDAWSLRHNSGAQNGVSDAYMPLNSLLGVFLDDGQPNLSPAPSPLSFGPGGNVSGGIDYLALAPALKQVFFIGDGLTIGGKQQLVIVPTGATRLFLGSMDGWEWANNSGSFNVDVSAVPEPATVSLLGLGVIAAGLVRRLRRS